ncbi:MAG TPA: hydroxymethylbilane synthase [Acidimicrobiales bacterium]|nr:hydroxymethylbilane synthase [Acidimicrobiales bacterium]
MHPRAPAGRPDAGWPHTRPLRLATRGSPLARRQTDMVAHLLAQGRPGLVIEPVVVRTEGDRRSEEPLERIGGQGVFVKEIQQAVLDGRADVAVHSAKDLPPFVAPGLVLAAVPVRGDARDALVGSTLAALGSGARVATGAARRRAQLANLRPDLCFVAARGNIETRLARANGDGADAVVVAAAALDRLSITSQAAEILSPLVMLPQVGQGAIALECAADDEAVRGLLALVDHQDSHRALIAERTMLAAMGASCSLPVGGWAEPDGPRLHLRGMVASADGRIQLHADGWGADPVTLGTEVAHKLLHDCGADRLLGQDLGARRGEPAR